MAWCSALAVAAGSASGWRSWSRVRLAWRLYRARRMRVRAGGAPLGSLLGRRLSGHLRRSGVPERQRGQSVPRTRRCYRAGGDLLFSRRRIKFLLNSAGDLAVLPKEGSSVGTGGGELLGQQLGDF